MSPSPAADRLTGALLALIAVCVVAHEWGAPPGFDLVADVSTAALMVQLSLLVDRGRRIYVLIGAALAAATVLTRADWSAPLLKALDSAAFIAAFFATLTSLRHAALGSAAIRACGRFLAEQPPGRRYATLTLGGQLFGLILGYAALALLGSLAEAGAREEPDAARRTRRLRRMLLAVQRGFVSTLPWSPLAFAVAISTSLIPGARWLSSLGGCLVTAVVLVGVGWALDRFDTPKGVAPVPAAAFKPRGGWLLLWPLVALLGLLLALVAAAQAVVDVRTIAVVMLAAPAMAFAWVAAQNAWSQPLASAALSGRRYVAVELPKFRGEILLLAMAGFIGTLGGALAQPLAAWAALDPAQAPAWAILAALVWLLPATGQIGMNPILTTSLAAPLLPPAAAIGVAPEAYIVAITAGWALSGASSPYTATTLMVGALGGVDARHVGVRWNGAYTLICGAILTGWTVLYAQL